MNNYDYDGILHVLSECNGYQYQQDVAIEEMGELTQALIKLRRTINEENVDDYDEVTEHVIEEIADVEICMRSLELMFNCGQDVETMKQVKAFRAGLNVKKKLKRDRPVLSQTALKCLEYLNGILPELEEKILSTKHGKEILDKMVYKKEA